MLIALCGKLTLRHLRTIQEQTIVVGEKGKPMSILIKGMDMPKNGDYTFHFASDENGENTIVLIRNNLTGTIVANEGVIEIPTPHGRLIDADALEYKLGASDEDIYVRGVLEEDAPTILEAEE